MPILLLGFLLAGIYFLFQSQIQGGIVTVKSDVNNFRYDLDSIYQKWGNYYGIDWRLIKAIAQHESSENPSAVDPNDPSLGIMQVLCTGYPNTITCKNTLNVQNWPPLTFDKLFDPDYNIEIGTSILKWNLDTYGFPKGIAVYNDWESRNDDANGPFTNQSYVDDVLSRYQSLGGTF